MTIELQTGLPGACKTQYTLWRVEKQMRHIVVDGEKVKRPVFYSGIPIKPEALPDWQLIEADQWYTAPPESIVIIDEAQRVFRPRPNGSQVPRYEAELETHRHGGIDLILITQSPRLVSIGVRELVGRHFHAVRRWGMEWSTIHQWPECRLNVQSRKDSVQHQFKFRKEVFGWYKSAEAHTIKRQVPFKVWLFLALPFILGLLIWQISASIDKRAHPDHRGGQGGQVNATASTSSTSSARAPLSTADYLAQQKPRIGGLAYTAPAYDDVTKPVRAPYPAACVQSKTKGCRCYTQQGTRLEVPKDLCEAISDGGFFMAWDDRPAAGAWQGASAPVQGQSASVGAPVPLSPGHHPRNPVRPNDRGGMSALSAEVASGNAENLDGAVLAWMKR